MMTARFSVILQGDGLSVSFGDRRVLDQVSLAVAPQEVVAVQGASGSGKTTLLRVLAGIQEPDSGQVMYHGADLAGLTDRRRSELRLAEFGFVFQFGDLVPELTVRENIELPLEFLGVGRKERAGRVGELIDAVGLGLCADQLPHTISGGERQRAAVARALVHRPRVLFADEPTGSLDSAARDVVLDLLAGMVAQFTCALVLVTHDPLVARRCDRVVELADGRVVSGR